MDSVESCKDEARLHNESDIFNRYVHLETVITTRPHPDMVKEEMRLIDRQIILKQELLVCHAEELKTKIFEQMSGNCAMDVLLTILVKYITTFA